MRAGPRSGLGVQQPRADAGARLEHGHGLEAEMQHEFVGLANT